VRKIPVRLNVYPSGYNVRPHPPAGLEHATIRDNIIFGSIYGYDEDRYNAVVDVCALRPDLSIFEAGDLTGELFIAFVDCSAMFLFTNSLQRSARKESPFRRVNAPVSRSREPCILKHQSVYTSVEYVVILTSVQVHFT
jgi:hypothetical protein